MRRAGEQRSPTTLPVLFPAFMLTVFFVVPFGIMLAVSFFRRVQGAFYEPAFVLDNYARFLTLFFAGRLGFSLFLAALVAADLRRRRAALHLPARAPPAPPAGRSGWSACSPSCRCRR